MQIVQATFAVFHQFELAQQLHQRGHLRRIYTTWPWARVKREGLPKHLVSTFPYVHTTDYLLGGKGFYPPALAQKMKRWSGTTFDRWTALVAPQCDAFIGLSGIGMLTCPRVQQRGGKYVCDRGSTHHRFQTETLEAEYRRWQVPVQQGSAESIERDEQVYALADAITVPSAVARRSFIQQGIAADKIRVIPYGVRLQNFSRTGEPPSDSFEVLFVGQVSLRKGIPYLLEAFSRLQHPRKHLTVVGTVQAHMEPLLKTLPLEHVTFKGALPQAEVKQYMSRSHVLMLSSIEEGLALVQAQALACELPIIATEATGAEDLFTDGVEGFIVPDRDVDALASRLQQLADDEPLRRQMSAAALARVQHLGGWERYGTLWDDFLHELTGCLREDA